MDHTSGLALPLLEVTVFLLAFIGATVWVIYQIGKKVAEMIDGRDRG